jgi:hypothetical protein
VSDPRLDLGFNTPFAEQLDFFRQKLNLPTEHWDDIKRAAHDRSFIVAGAMKADLLADLNTAVATVIAEGKSIGWFRDNFAAIVTKHGWHGWKGEGTPAGEAWRTKVIYQTNLSTSYAAGRYRQLTDPELLTLRPYWRYKHADGVANPRLQHVAWNGLTLPHDHVFWQTHFPPNGWGCHCRTVAVNAREYAKSEAAGLTEPPDGWDDIDEKTGAPVGIAKGFDYAPGASVADEMRALVKAKTETLPPALGKALSNDSASLETSAQVVEREAAYRKLIPYFDDWVKDARKLLVKRGESDRGLSDVELVSLHLYAHDRTMANYQFINRALRGAGDSGDMALLKPAIDTINAALEKLPAYTGKVKRGTFWIPDEEIAKYQAGNILHEPAFLSTSTKKGFKGNYQYEIVSKSGRDIAFLSNHAKEAEVLMPSGLDYRVAAVTKKGDVLKVTLEEI